MQMGLYASHFPDMGATFHILLQMGATFPQMGAAFSLLFCRWGLRNFVHTQMGAAFLLLRSKFFSDGGYGSEDGGDVLNCYADWGYGGAL